MFGEFAFLLYLCGMNLMMTILTDRELFLLIIGSVTYVALFVVTVKNSRQKVLQLQERINKVHVMQEEQQAFSRQSIEANEKRIAELESLMQKLGDENSMLRLELEEKKARLDYDNRLAVIENEKRQQAETIIFGSDVYMRIKKLTDEGRSMKDEDWRELEQTVNSVYSSFTERLFSLYRMTPQDYHVSLLTKVRMQPRDIAVLTAHSKESIASTRSRLYTKVFGEKGSSKDWDDFVLSL